MNPVFYKAAIKKTNYLEMDVADLTILEVDLRQNLVLIGNRNALNYSKNWPASLLMQPFVKEGPLPLTVEAVFNQNAIVPFRSGLDLFGCAEYSFVDEEAVALFACLSQAPAASVISDFADLPIGAIFQSPDKPSVFAKISDEIALPIRTTKTNTDGQTIALSGLKKVVWLSSVSPG